MSDPKVLVRPFLRIVANGRRRAPGGDRLKFTLIATPEFGGKEPFAEEDGAFEFQNWPSAMADRLRRGHAGEPFAGRGGLTLHARGIVASPVPAIGEAGSDWQTVLLSAAAARAFDDAGHWSEITRLWQRALAGPSAVGWEQLATDIARSLGGAKHKAALSGKYAGETAQALLDGRGALIAAPLDPAIAVTVKGVLPIRQSDFAIEEEGERAARVLAKQLNGPFMVLDDREEPNEASYREKFNAAVLGSDGERGRTHQTAEAVKGLISNGTEPAVPVQKQTKAHVIPQAADVVAEKVAADAPPVGKEVPKSGRGMRRATHQYGTWLQRRTEYAVEAGKLPPRISDIPIDSETNRLHARMRGVFFALQGDPTLARLFCLAIDFEVAEAEFLAKVGQEKVHLAVAMPKQRMALIATAARRHAHGFWPVSAFEAHVVQQTDDKGTSRYVVLDRQDFVEQRDGIWKLGEKRKLVEESVSKGATTTVEVEVPRYDLVSLDLRRSIDGKTTGRDRGEPHQTGGFTILDRGRADQIARDLALSSMQYGSLGKPNKVIVLHAEELTVGRRVDVAAAKPETEIGQLTWRSLMHRYVDFDFKAAAPNVKGVLRLLFPEQGRKGLLEEVSFQVAARYMPVKVANVDQACEAVAEEAIFLWDGTPAGVLTESGLGAVSKQGDLPFDRILDLPAGKADQDLCPAPLRFGYPYLFRLRSMFLGGGSPGPLDADTKDCTGPDCILPAALVKPETAKEEEVATVKPRRFLRHESIGAPVLMLPKALAEQRLGQMGYEQADQAIIRSWNSDRSPLDEISDAEEIRGAYVGADDRTKPGETTRVLIAPEVALDLVVRHGMLDQGDTAKIRRGALTDVTFTPRPKALLNESSEVKVVPSGFPVAITSERDTLDREGAVYRRKLAATAVAKERGIPVFEAGGTNTTGAGSLGYLPDPAIDHYAIRARIRGSDRYLDDFIEVPLYGATGYPNMVPLAVTVKRADGGARAVRAGHPESIENIATLVKNIWMDEAGEFKRTKPPRGTLVHQVVLKLYPGEDFDIEVACLPSARTLSRHFSVPETIAMQLKLAGTEGPRFERLKSICSNAVAKACRSAGGVQPLTGLGGETVSDQATLDSVAQELLTAMQTDWPVEEIAAITTLRACHAVNKPPLLARWHGTEPVVAFRQPETIACDRVTDPPLADVPGATGLFLKGKVELDLALVDSFQIVAETVATDGPRLDSGERGRSTISRRSGRWPRLLTPEGEESYVSAADVVGFSVAENGQVTLPRQTVTLLDVGNLPAFGAVGEVQKRFLDTDTKTCRVPKQLPCEFPQAGAYPGAPVFGATRGRLTAIELAPLFAAASMSAPITQRIAMPPGGRDGAGRTRMLKTERPHIFKDTLARKLTLKLVSVSRQASAFETAPAYFQGREQLLYRRQPLKRTDQAMLGTPFAEIWMKSTRRPAVPDLRRPEPSFVIERSAGTSTLGVMTHRLTRRSMTRLYFGRGWFSSGEGERVGVVLWPPDYLKLTSADIDRDIIQFGGRALRLDAFEDRDLGEGGAFVTRWGGDPIRQDKSPQQGNFIPPEAFADLKRLGEGPHRPGFESPVLMPIPKSASAKTGEGGDDASAEAIYDHLPVSLITYEPCFDLDREEWYVDIDLKPIRASEPFVRFGVVRYQKQSISQDLCVSEPVTVTMQLLPERHVEVEESKGADFAGRRVSVKVKGLGSTDIKELPVALLPGSESERSAWQKNFDTLRRPKMKLALFHEADRGQRGLVRTPIEAEGLVFDDLLQCELPEPDLENTTLVWSCGFNLPDTVLNELGKGRIVAYFEEIDRRMPASYRIEPITPKAMFALGQFVESGPRFSARVPFLEV